MSSKRPSGAQQRKRKAEEKREAKKSCKLLESFFKKARSSNEESEENQIMEEDENDDQRDQVLSTDDEKESNNMSQTNVVNAENFDFEKFSSSETEEDEEEKDNNDTSIIPPNPVFNVLMFNDVGYLDFDKTSQLPIISQKLRTEMVTRGSTLFQNKEGPFGKKDNRSMTKSWFNRRLANGQGDEVNRSWLVYSKIKETAYCFCCLLFSSSTPNCRSSFELEKGFNQWKKIEKVSAHESNSCHRKSFNTWKETERRLFLGQTVDAALEVEIQTEVARWRDILKRILSCIKFLATQNLALRGHMENLRVEENKNVGNFLSLLQLLAQYDPVLRSHLEHAQKNTRLVSYLSPDIQNEFISILASEVKNHLLCDIRRNKYYGILFDSTPDLGHREQMSEVIRYVDVDFVTRKVEIKESFIGFIEIHGKDAATIDEAIVQKLESDKIALQDCRSQCYDNAAVMSGRISGVQQRIQTRNSKALFVNCDNHSLNLSGVHAASQDPVVVTFFGTVEKIFFFSRSTL